MKVSILQLKVAFADPETNYAALERLAAQAMESQPDVLVLPELWRLGFFPRPVKKYADVDGEEARERLSALAKRYCVNVVGGTIARLETTTGEVYNTCYVFGRDGEAIASYDKVHLFSPGGESEEFTAGERFTYFSLDGVKCAVAVCYDLRFGRFIERAAEGAAVLFIPAGWPFVRLSHWTTLVRARAIEHQLFVAAANEAGGLMAEQPMAGHSLIVDPWGQTLAEAGEGEEIISANLRLAIQSQVKDTITVSRDKRRVRTAEGDRVY